MSKELKYYCTIVGVITETTLTSLSRIHNMRLEEARTKVDDIINLIENKGLTENQIIEYRRFLNIAGIGIRTDMYVRKRKYVRKNTKDSIEIKNLPDIKEGISVITDRINRRTNGRYIISKIDSKHIHLSKTLHGAHIARYTYSQFYEKFSKGRWGFESPTDRQIIFFNTNDNIISSSKFQNVDFEARAYFESGYYFTIIPNATYNCQLCILGYAQNLITYSSNILGQLKEIRKYTGKRLILIDIKDTYFKDLNEILGDNFTKKNYVKMHTPYTSTNGSSMHILMFNTENI